MQLLIDLFDCNPAKLDDPKAVESLLVKAPDALNLLRAQDSSIHTWRSVSGGQDGEAGLLQLVDGTLEIFTGVMFAQAWVSLFRLVDFDRDAVTAWFVAELEADEADLQVVQRGPRIRSPRPGPAAPWLRTGRPR